MSMKYLFERWESERCKLTFVRDGIINNELFHESRSKILIIMKEAPVKQGTMNITEEVESAYLKNKNNALHDLFLVLARQVYAISTAINGDEPVDYMNIEGQKVNSYEYSHHFRSCAYINIKKYHGNDRSNNKDLIDTTIRDRSFLKEQIDLLIKPRVILCNGTFKMYKELYSEDDIRKIGNTYFYFHENRNRLVKVGYHPQQTKKSDKEVYESINKQLQNEDIAQFFKKFCAANE